MAVLTIEYRKQKWMPALPHKVLVNGQILGVMQQPTVNVEMPQGEYRVRIQSMIPFLSSERSMVVQEGVKNVLSFYDREQVWDLLFWIALVAEVVHCFVTLTPGWDIVYHVIDDGFFLAWLIYEWCIRKRYFKMEFWQSAKRLP
ncbi:MAG: hypothetical protein MJZ51_06465 [Bacteroidales bacterium]|nr:hypothetical protein [Bacteroidales bacterium]